MKTSTLGFLMIAAVVLCASVAAVSGAYHLDAQQVLNLVAGTDGVPMQDKIVFWQIRLPRILAALLLGRRWRAQEPPIRACSATRWSRRIFSAWQRVRV